MTSKPRLEGKVAIITGAASGIGEAAARLFAAHGATVVIADIQDQLGLQVAASAEKCTYVHCDITDEPQVEAVVAHTVATHGRLDILYSNAGILGPITNTILDLDRSDFDRVMSVNVTGSALAIKHAAKAMVAGGIRGSIVCTTSVCSRQAGFGAPAAYTASKHALLGLIRAAAGELGAHGIRVNSVSPFIVATPLSCGGGGFSAEKLEAFSCTVSNLKGVVLKAGHIAEAALFLASEESVFVSGHDLAVDGGATVVSGLSQIVALSGSGN